MELLSPLWWQGRIIHDDPKLFFIGAMKSGTTAFYYYLEQHPEIYMSPVKDPNFLFAGAEEHTSLRFKLTATEK